MIVVTAVLVAAVGLSTAAALRARVVADRVIAIDVAVVALVALLAVDGATRRSTVFLDVLPVLGLLAVLGTLAAAWAVRRQPDLAADDGSHDVLSPGAPTGGRP